MFFITLNESDDQNYDEFYDIFMVFNNYISVTDVSSLFVTFLFRKYLEKIFTENVIKKIIPWIEVLRSLQASAP